MSPDSQDLPTRSNDTPRPRKPTRFRWVEFLIVLGMIGLVIALLLPATRSARPAARRMQCRNNLKQIALALHNYAEDWKAFPPAYTVDAVGDRLHSWRTLILPYLEQRALYEMIDLSKAWDDPANVDAFETVISAYRCPSIAIDAPDTHTTYLAVVAAGSCFLPTDPRQLSEITDGMSETLMVIEVDPENAVHWMSPLDADEKQVLGLGLQSELAHSGGMHGALVDGSVDFLFAEMPAAERRELISISRSDE